LGMMLTFRYCRLAQGKLPCRNIIGCWEERIPVDDFLKEHFTSEELKMLFGAPPKSRLDRIFEGMEASPPKK